MKMNFWEKSENVMFLHSLRLSFMPKIRKIYRAVFRENLVRERDRETDRETERQTERDGPEYKGPPDAIAKPSDQKRSENVATITSLVRTKVSFALLRSALVCIRGTRHRYHKWCLDEADLESEKHQSWIKSM